MKSNSSLELLECIYNVCIPRFIKKVYTFMKGIERESFFHHGKYMVNIFCPFYELILSLSNERAEQI